MVKGYAEMGPWKLKGDVKILCFILRLHGRREHLLHLGLQHDDSVSPGGRRRGGPGLPAGWDAGVLREQRGLQPPVPAVLPQQPAEGLPAGPAEDSHPEVRPEVGIYKRKKVRSKNNAFCLGRVLGYFLLFSVKFLFSWSSSCFLLVESVFFSCFTFLFSFINSHLSTGLSLT